MAKKTASWIGASGKEYVYLIYPIETDFDPDQDGNYIFTKMEDDEWVPVYIGEGDLQDRINDPEHRPCALDRGATHLHVHLNPLEDDRTSEERDLLANHPEAYDPPGCNRKLGG